MPKIIKRRHIRALHREPKLNPVVTVDRRAISPGALPQRHGKRLAKGIKPTYRIKVSPMETIAIPGAEIHYEKNFLPAAEATTLFNVLEKKCAWERRKTAFHSAVPRDEAYYGDPGTNYTYSRREYQPRAWIPELLSLKARVDEATPASAYANLGLPKLPYNAVLCNLYRNGRDSVGWHADAEPEMGPVIASVSLGVERLFHFKAGNGAVVFAERLSHGSLFIMAGETQKNLKHEVPKEPDILQPRINLTFRRIQHQR